MNLLPRAEIWCPLSVLERVCIIEGFFQRKCMRILSVHRRQTVCNREVSVPRGSTVVYYGLSAWLQCYLQIYNPRKKS